VARSLLVHQNPLPWYDADYVLTHFGRLKAYRAFMREGVEKKRVPDLGGGLVRSLGGPAETTQQKGDPVRADARILGTGDFVKSLLGQDKSYASQEERRKTMTNLIERHCERAGILPRALRAGNRAGNISALRSELAYALIERSGYSICRNRTTIGHQHVGSVQNYAEEGRQVMLVNYVS
jgi:hypothetical protein